MKYFKIHISSANVVSGTWQNGTYFVDVAVEELDPDYHWQLCVEKFISNTSFTDGFMMVSPSIPFVNTMYSTITKGPLNVLFISTGNDYNKITDWGTIGQKISGPLCFRSNQINLQLLDLTGAALTADDVVWSMIMVLYATKKQI